MSSWIPVCGRGWVRAEEVAGFTGMTFAEESQVLYLRGGTTLPCPLSVEELKVKLGVEPVPAQPQIDPDVLVIRFIPEQWKEQEEMIRSSLDKGWHKRADIVLETRDWYTAMTLCTAFESKLGGHNVCLVDRRAYIMKGV